MLDICAYAFGNGGRRGSVCRLILTIAVEANWRIVDNIGGRVEDGGINHRKSVRRLYLTS
jgi:hypothetical protein